MKQRQTGKALATLILIIALVGLSLGGIIRAVTTFAKTHPTGVALPSAAPRATALFVQGTHPTDLTGNSATYAVNSQQSADLLICDAGKVFPFGTSVGTDATIIAPQTWRSAMNSSRA